MNKGKPSGKIRIYDLAKSLVPDGLSDKEAKDVKSQKTKRILEVCQQLGLPIKTASSSLSSEYVSLVLENLNKDTIEPIVPASTKDEPKTKSMRVVRRISSPTTNVEPTTNEIEEPLEVNEQFKDFPPEEEITEQMTETNLDSPDNNDDQIEPNPTKETMTPTTIEPKTKEEPPIASTSDSKKHIASIKLDPSNKKEEMSQISAPNNEQPKTKSISVEKPQTTTASKNQTHHHSQNNRPQQPAKNRPSGNTSTPKSITTPNASNYKKPFRIAKPAQSQFGSFGKKKASKKKTKNRISSSSRARSSNFVEEKPSIITVSKTISVHGLSELLKVSENEIIRVLFIKGIVRTINQTLDRELIEEVCANFDCEVLWDDSPVSSNDLNQKLQDLVSSHKALDEMVPRPPVVTIMGHVDHGKTTLLDAIRRSKKQITDGESGGITQHIGAYQVNVSDHEGNERKVTFLDTPGHEAFTALRARGAQVTDIAILVVAADDGVMPQTIEAMSHAKAAGVPIIVAVNKVDKPEANSAVVLGQLAEQSLLVEEYGGDVVCSHISAKQKLNLDDLLSKITLVADVELADKLKADPNQMAVGAVIESALSPNKGTVATLLVQSGSLSKGDWVVAGTASGRIRAIINDDGQEIQSAGPATPIQILGLDSQPKAGDTFQVVKSLQEAKSIATKRKEENQSNRMQALDNMSLDIREGMAKELPVIIKSDVQGSAEAIAQELNKISTQEVSVRIIHSAPGTVTESDINLASTTGAIIINFNSSIDASSLKLSQELSVQVLTYNVIYHVAEAVKSNMSGLLDKERVEIKQGEVEVREIFSIGKNKMAGCLVTQGKMMTNSIAKIRRNKQTILTLSLTSLRRFKDNVKEVQEGYECGIYLDGFSDYELGDVIECWSVEMRERTL